MPALPAPTIASATFERVRAPAAATRTDDRIRRIPALTPASPPTTRSAGREAVALAVRCAGPSGQGMLRKARLSAPLWNRRRRLQR